MLAQGGESMLYLECAVKTPAALGENRVVAEIRDRAGRLEQVIVKNAFLTRRSGRTFLPVWFISQDHDSGLVQVELPEEAASGVNRIWVNGTDAFVTEENEGTAKMILSVGLAHHCYRYCHHNYQQDDPPIVFEQPYTAWMIHRPIPQPVRQAYSNGNAIAVTIQTQQRTGERH